MCSAPMERSCPAPRAATTRSQSRRMGSPVSGPRRLEGVGCTSMRRPPVVATVRSRSALTPTRVARREPLPSRSRLRRSSSISPERSEPAHPPRRRFPEPSGGAPRLVTLKTAKRLVHLRASAAEDGYAGRGDAASLKSTARPRRSFLIAPWDAQQCPMDLDHQRRRGRRNVDCSVANPRNVGLALGLHGGENARYMFR